MWSQLQIRVAVLILVFFQIIPLRAQYSNYTKSYNWDVFAAVPNGGGGGVSLSISNNVLSLSFNAGFSQTLLKQGKVTSTGYNGTLPDTEIPIPTGSFFSDKGYRFFIIDNYITIYGQNPVTLSGFSGTISVNLTTPVAISSDVLAGINGSSDNKITITDYLSSSGNVGKKKISIMYYDGLGRELQSVSQAYTPAGKDLIIPFEYDDYGRKLRDYLPIPTTQNSGLRVNVGNLLSQANSVYNNEPAYYETFPEQSPLNRPIKRASLGADWKLGSGHEIKYEYDVNTSSDEVKRLLVSLSLTGDAYIPSLYFNSLYPEGTLIKKVTKDEDWTQTSGQNNTSEEFVNKEGETVLIRKYSEGERLDTYYVYDDYGNLSYVISPLASESSKNIYSGIFSHETLDDLCYQYIYDIRNRLIEKKLPGKGWEYMAYDRQDRLVMTQDAERRDKGEWIFTKYDRFSRVVYTGISYIGSYTRNQVQSSINYYISQGQPINEEKNGSGFNASGLTFYYTNTVYPTSISKLLTVNYYDTYPSDNPLLPSNIQGQTILTPASNSSLTPKGLLTATYLNTLEYDDWQKKYFYYNEKLTIVGNYSFCSQGGYTKTENLVDFLGVPQTTITYHRKNSSVPETVISERFVYDNQNRQKQHFHKVDSQNEELLSDIAYNELSQVSGKKTGNSTLQDISYTYNIRGWLKGINVDGSGNFQTSKLFNYNIFYNTLDSQYSGSPRFNGNIAQVTWKTNYYGSDTKTRNYAYTYDGVNRLKAAIYKNSATETGYYDESMSYDANGNIKKLLRNNPPIYGTTPTLIDNLTYIYNGNKVSTITDATGNSTGYPIGGGIFGYDLNGNMTSQNDKGFSKIIYNILNLPTEINHPSGNVNYVYSADGTKLKKTYNSEITEYRDGFQYVNGNLQFVPTAEGYYDFVSRRYVYHYNDHLGNVRLSYYKDPQSGTLKIVEENNYYPFGLKHLGYNTFSGNPLYQYKYNGKELQETGMYDYGARFYMPDIGRWGVVDPLAEKYPSWSPYAYTFNNPINFIDPDGREGTDWYKNNLTQNIEWHDGSKEIAGYTNITKEAAGRPMAVIEKDGGGNVTATNWLNNDGSITRNGETIMNGYSATTALGRTITSRNPWESIVNAEGGNGVPFNLTWRDVANGAENTGAAIEIASIAGLLPSGGTSTVTATAGVIIGGAGTALNIGLDFSEQKYGSAIARGAIWLGTAGLGAAIDNVVLKSQADDIIIKGSGLVPRGSTSEKILRTNSFIFGEIGNSTVERIYESKK